MSQYINKIRTDAGDLQINYNALANLPTISNPNLLINSDFRNPVNQRGQTTYIGATDKTYTIDRWCHNTTDEGRTLQVLNGYVKYSNPNTTYQSFWLQHFERKLEDGYYTITVNVKSVTKDVWVGNMLGDSSSSVKWGNSSTFALKSGINTFTFYGSAIGLYFQASISSSVELYWVKLEYGNTPTAFVPRLYGEELALCRRYYSVLVPSCMIIARQRYDGYSSYFAGMPYPNVMRVVPNVTYDSKVSDTGEILTGTLGMTRDEYCISYFSFVGDKDGIELTKVLLDAEIY